MPTIGLTTFIDFLTSTGVGRVAKVRSAKLNDNDAYDPRKDFYKRLREAVASYHSGAQDRDALRNLPLQLSDHKKKSNFPLAIDGLLKFEAKNIQNVSKSAKGEFRAHGLNVNVNPECVYGIAGEAVSTKLWFKTEQIPKTRVPLILATMKLALTNHSGPVAILDTRRRQIHQVSNSPKEFEILLRAEAGAFMEIWNGLGED